MDNLSIFNVSDVVAESFEERLKKSIFETGDTAALDMYVKLKSAKNALGLDFYGPYAYENYAQVFGLCRCLGITNLYDIGCGNALQAFLLLSHQNIFYTGIDMCLDFAHINETFSKICGERIKFQKAEYPFEITPAVNNAAISCYAIGMEASEDQSIKKIAGALSKDFERILMNINDKNFKIWENQLSDFTLHKIGNGNFVFGTKFPEDVDRLNKMHYNCYDSRFTIGVANGSSVTTKSFNKLF